MIVLLPLVWLLLTKLIFRLERVSSDHAAEEIRRRLAKLGPMSRGEKTVLVVFILTAFSWMFRADIALPTFTIPGWSGVFPFPKYIHDSTVAIFFAALLFVIPVDLKKGEFALDWEWAQRIPWGVLILFGGGLALAKGFKETGLVEWLGNNLESLSNLPAFLVILLIALMLTFLTELTSNTATTTIMMPILGGAAAMAIGVNPLLLMIPAAISASCAFMMPVATPPNAIVFGAGYVTIAQMAKTGIIINLIGAVFVALLVYFVAVPVFGIDLGQMPSWALP